MNSSITVHPNPVEHPMRVSAFADDFVAVRVGPIGQEVAFLLHDEGHEVEVAKWLRDAAEQLNDLAIRVDRRAATRKASA